MLSMFAPHALGGVANSTETSDPAVSGGSTMSAGLGAASLATVSPDPEIINQGEEISADNLSQMNAVDAQWGSTVASISATATPTGASANVVTPVGAAQQASAPSNAKMLIIFGVIAVLVLILVYE